MIILVKCQAVNARINPEWLAYRYSCQVTKGGLYFIFMLIFFSLRMNFLLNEIITATGIVIIFRCPRSSSILTEFIAKTFFTFLSTWWWSGLCIALIRPFYFHFKPFALFIIKFVQIFFSIWKFIWILIIVLIIIRILCIFIKMIKSSEIKVIVVGILLFRFP